MEIIALHLNESLIITLNPLHFLALQVFTFSQKISVNFQLLLRFIQGVAFLLALAGVAVAVALTNLTIADIFACILAFVPTGWGILSVSFSSSSLFIIILVSSCNLNISIHECEC